MNDQALNIKFVEEVEKHPCLYNFTLSDYSRKDVTERAWGKIGKIFNMTESQSKEKWKNLRTVFARHTKPALSGSSSKCIRPYYLSDAMQFTIPYLKTLKKTREGKGREWKLPQQALKEVMEQDDNEEPKKSEETDDAKRFFLLSLLPDMKAMSESQTRTFKRRVLALVDEILEEPQTTSWALPQLKPEYSCSDDR